MAVTNTDHYNYYYHIYDNVTDSKDKRNLTNALTFHAKACTNLNHPQPHYNLYSRPFPTLSILRSRIIIRFKVHYGPDVITHLQRTIFQVDEDVLGAIYIAR
jgi:hypothetical protein